MSNLNKYKSRSSLLLFSLLFTIVFVVPTTNSFSFDLDDGVEIVKVIKDVVVMIAKAWNVIDDNVDVPSMNLPVFNRREKKLFGNIETIISKLDRQAESVETVGTTTMITMLQSLPDRVRLELRLNNLLDYITRMDVAYGYFQNYVNKYNTFEKATLEDFAFVAVSHDSSSVISLTERINAFVTPNTRGVISDSSLLVLLRKALDEVENTMLCDTKQSNQQIMYNLYKTIALTELKGFSMIQFSYMLLRLYGKGNFTTESQVIRERYEERTNHAVEIVRSAMKNASRELWMCDPKKHVAGETYEEITQLLQGYVQNEVDLNPDQTCRENCAEYTYTKSHGCFKDLYCRQQRRCNGKVINCQFYDSDMWICPANPLSGRRYDYIEYENGRLLGRKQGGCTRGVSKVDSWWRWLFWHCSYCFCLCDEQGRNSDRYFNMRHTIADIEDNKVVTGLRFTKKNRIIHLQIQQGILQPGGTIDRNSLEWKPLDDYQITDRDIYNGKDYHTLTWEKRAIDLDDLEADEGYLLTGVRFKEIGSHLNFEIYITKFDFATGKLIPDSSIWKDNPNTDASIKNPRTKVKLPTPDIPIRSPLPSVPGSKSDQYIEFVNSDIDRDVAQTTVPYLDAQKVESLNAVPLSGAGIYHKGRHSFGGFIAPKIITYDFSQHLKAVFPDKEEIN